VLAETFAVLRQHGGGRRECVTYLLGPANAPDRVDEVVHPVHTTGRFGYEIDDAWLNAFWFDLARRRKSARVQVHTHPREAFHSTTDDEWALVHTDGFLSLVIPNFAMGPADLRGAFLAKRVPGGWRQVPVEKSVDLQP
jgi:hypothetical protein